MTENPGGTLPAVNRRSLITGLGALFLAAPAIVRVSSLMPISSRHLTPPLPEIEIGEWLFKYKVEIREGHGKLRFIHIEQERVGQAA